MKETDNRVVETARINLKETADCYFPYLDWDVKVCGNDVFPPHFHVLRDGWDVSFLIEDGSVYRINSKGPEEQIHDFMVSNVPKWLNAECSALPKITNQENAYLQWEQLQDE